MAKEIKLATGNGTRLTTAKRIFEITFGKDVYKFAVIDYPSFYMNSKEESLSTRVIHFGSGRLLPIQPPNKGVSVKKYVDAVTTEITSIFTHYGADKFKQEFEKYETINS
jgi:hypothetical protein